MHKAKRERLRKAGWKIGTAGEFLGLSEEESALVEIKLALARGLKRRRETQRLTQADLAERIGSSQSRVAKMEAADISVSIDLLVRSLLALGVPRSELGRLIGRQTAKPAA